MPSFNNGQSYDVSTSSGISYPAYDADKTPSPSQSQAISTAIKGMEREVAACRKLVGAEDVELADLLTKLAELYGHLRMYAEMETTLLESVKIRESVFGSEHPSVSTELKNLGRLYAAQSNYLQAEQAFRRALAIREKSLGRMHPRVAEIEEHYARLLRTTNRVHQAEALENHMNEIRRQNAAHARG